MAEELAAPRKGNKGSRKKKEVQSAASVDTGKRGFHPVNEHIGWHPVRENWRELESLVAQLLKYKAEDSFHDEAETSFEDRSGGRVKGKVLSQ